MRRSFNGYLALMLARSAAEHDPIGTAPRVLRDADRDGPSRSADGPATGSGR